VKKKLFPIFLVVLVDLLGFSILIPLLPFYAKEFGASALEAGFLVASYSVCQLFASPWLGSLSDRYGRKPVLLVSQVGTALSLVMMVWAPNLTFLFLARMFDGITAGNLSVAQAYVADVTEPEERAGAFAFINIGMFVGFFLGPMIAAVLGSTSMTGPIWVAVGFSVTSILATLFFLPESKENQTTKPNKVSSQPFSPWRFFKQANLRPTLLQFLIYIFALTYFVQGVGLYLEKKLNLAAGIKFGPVEVGYLFSYSGFITIVVQGFLIRKFIAVLGEKKLVAVSFLVGALAMGSLVWVNSFVFLAIAVFFISIAQSNLRPCLTGLASRKAPPNQQGELLGLVATLGSLGQITGPIAGGYFIDNGYLVGWPLVVFACYTLCLLINLRETNVSEQSEAPETKAA